MRNFNRHRKKERGAALLTVLVAMMIISLMLFEFQHSAMVERALAYNGLNQLRAYYLAKAGAQMGVLRVALYGRAKRDPGLKNLGKNFNPQRYLDMIWSLPLPPFPPDVTNLTNLTLKEKGTLERAAEQSKIAEGFTSHTIGSESSKINLNFLVADSSSRVDLKNIDLFDPHQDSLVGYIARTLYTLIDNMMKESEDPFLEYGNVKPEDVVWDIMDWVNKGSESVSGGDKDRFYLEQDPPYRAKRHNFYTVDELKLIRSINDALYKKLEPHVTVYAEGGKINLNTARKEIFKALYPEFRADDLDKLLQERTEREGWTSEEAFVKYVTEELNYSGFSDIYKDKNNYPFTVASESFLVDSLGVIERSNSTIQRKIRVAIALTSSNKVRADGSIRTKAECDKKKETHFWRPEPAGCFPLPKNESQCKSLAGQWEANPGGPAPFCCRVNKVADLACPPSGSGGATVDADAMKILYWSES